MGAQTDRLRCEVFQNLILSPINTGFLRHAVATALTVYGIETFVHPEIRACKYNGLQQPLPFTVLKLLHDTCNTECCCWLQQPLPFTVLKPIIVSLYNSPKNTYVATALTVYGIETCCEHS